MNDKEFFQKIELFKQIKPDSDWANWLKANILQRKPQNVLGGKPRVKLAVFSFISSVARNKVLPNKVRQVLISKYQKVMLPSLLAFFFVFSFAFSQTSLPGNVLYPLKTLTQNARIALVPKDYKPVVRLQITKARLEDMAKITDQEQAIALMSQNIQKDLQAIPQELKNIQKKQKTLAISKQVQNEAKDLDNMISKTQLQPQEKETLNKTFEDTKAKVFALIMDTQEEINNCPSYFKDKLAAIQTYFADPNKIFNNWSSDEIIKIKSELLEIENLIKGDNCLEALEKIESINTLLSIHSLDIKVETSTPLEIDF